MPTVPFFFRGSWGLNLSPHVCATRNLPTETSRQPLSLECEYELPLEESLDPRVLTSPNLRKTLRVKRCAEGDMVPQEEESEQDGVCFCFGYVFVCVHAHVHANVYEHL